jgi:hypothetical protein
LFEAAAVDCSFALSGPPTASAIITACVRDVSVSAPGAKYKYRSILGDATDSDTDIQKAYTERAPAVNLTRGDPRAIL